MEWLLRSQMALYTYIWIFSTRELMFRLQRFFLILNGVLMFYSFLYTYRLHQIQRYLGMLVRAYPGAS